MKVTVMTGDEQIVTLDVDRDESVENLKALLEVETRVPLRQQQIHFNGKEMQNTEKLSAAGVQDGDLVMMFSTSERPSQDGLRVNPDGTAVNPQAFQQHARGDSQLMAQLLQNDPQLAQAILGDDTTELQNILRSRHQQRTELKRKQEEELALLYADPFDVEAQKKIEAAIRQKGIDENWEAALEHNPEAFARVVMLYVDMEVNGVPLKAFVDSGAQSTIISKSCAERCGLLRLLDQRFRGIAVGVGQSEILGRIHVAPIKIGNIFYPCSFTVLDAPNMEFLFGLDMLRKHQCMIDLKDNVLRVGGGEVSVPFLQEKDIPAHIRNEEKLSKLGSLSQATGESSRTREGTPNALQQTPPGAPAANPPQGGDFEAKVTKLVELGFDRASVTQALKLFNGNEEQAAAFLFGG
ncbi:protein DNA-DAMAGE INDUCIBLE 1 isoform X2 [Zea mays]|uniref:Ubiquitin family protein n=1 Tax=Zea mays TaxID=4577 RepID=K7UR93_MAIZE|nr:protein DNA-DAMAGE INDUCIBLE 1 isoform X2 [Zea mays]AQK60022.1 ubiquitin family protein [Zea mays]|eukprot:XP_008679880.1 UBA domain-containing protein mud1 isoform X2 [Zea mays]